MPNWVRLVFDLLSPTLVYSVIYSALFAIAIYFLLAIFKIENPKLRSFLYMVPLLAPLVIFTLVPPRLTLVLLFFSSDTNAFVTTQVYSLAGLLYLVGLILSLVFFILFYMFGHKLAYWLQGVIELEPEENPSLFAMTERLAKRAGVPIPRLGITEDLRPNAFTTGSGKSAAIVVTLGLLNTLTETELEAVLAHELAHIKNRDVLFNMLTVVLQVVSFFNPLAYFLAAAIRREREVLADRTGITFLKQPAFLGLALTKLWETSQSGVRHRLRGWLSGVFILSEMKFARKMLSKHPPLENRLTHLVRGRSWNNPRNNDVLRIVVACFLVITMVLWVFIPLIRRWMYFSGMGTPGVNAFGLQTVPDDVTTTMFVVDSNYFRISNYLRIYDYFGLYNYVRLIYLPYRGADDPVLSPPGGPDFSVVYTTNYPSPPWVFTILPWIVTFLVIAMIVILLLRVCFTDLGNARTHKKSGIE